MCIIQACTHDTAPYIQPITIKPACDTAMPSYKTCIKPIFIGACYRCHSDSASQHGSIAFNIQDLNALRFYLNSHYRGDTIYGSKFMAVIGYKSLVVHMPIDYKLPNTQISLIQTWVSQGAIDN